MLIDIHSHLDHNWFDKDREKVIKNPNLIVITSGINPETNRFSLDLTKKYDNVKCTIGIYPKEAFEEERKELRYKDFDINEEIKWIEEQIKKDKNQKNKLIFGVGEIGLDFVDIKEDKEKIKKDIDLFRKQLKLAKKYNLPVVIHSRKAEKEVIDILEEEFNEEKQKKVILHAFGGSRKLLKRALELGYYFSVPPVVVRSSNFQMIVEETPLSQLLTETDSPYLGVNREERNEPKNVIFTIKKIAEIKQISEEEVEKTIYDNYKSLRG